MPYKIKGKCIYKKDTGAKVGCTKGDVHKYMAALQMHAHESEDKSLDEIRLFIRSVLSENLLSEDYESIKQIKDLANDVLVYAGKANLDYILRQHKEGNISHLYPVRLLDVYQQNPKKYPTLQDFIINSNIMVEFVKSNSDKDSGRDVRGSYTWVNDNEYDKTRSRSIKLYYNEKYLNEELSRKITGYSSFEYHDVYSTFYYMFERTLEHEIQHAYDDYRSNSNLFRAKSAEKFRDKYHLANGTERTISDPIKQGYKHKEYLNLQHEIWARFTEAVNQTRFDTVDFLKTPADKNYLKYEMKPLETVVQNFTSEFSGWRLLPDKMKKKLIGRVVQYWHKAAEELPEKNRKELEKTRKEEPQLAEVRKIVRTVLSEDKKKELSVGDEIHLPELTMNKNDLIKYLKEMYSIDLKE